MCSWEIIVLFMAIFFVNCTNNKLSSLVPGVMSPHSYTLRMSIGYDIQLRWITLKFEIPQILGKFS